MRLVAMAVLAATVFTLAAASSEAATRKRSLPPEVRAMNGEAGVTVRRSRTRITVTRRSYLDPGTEVRQGSKHYTDYVFPPNYRGPTEYYLGPSEANRNPLPHPWWLRSESAPGWGY